METQTGACHVLRACSLLESMKDKLMLLGRDAHSLIDNRKVGIAIFVAGFEYHGFRFGAELESIVEQIVNDLGEEQSVAPGANFAIIQSLKD